MIAAGDIRRVGAGGAERLVLVLKVLPERSSAQITLIHPYIEYATPSDIVVGPSESGVRYDIVAQPALRGVVRLDDLGPLVCTVPADVVDACLSPVPGSARSITVLDARWEFKQSERADLWRVCSNYFEEYA